MASFIKILRVLPRQEYKTCVVVFFLMVVSVALETISVGLIFPLISAMGDENFLQQHIRLSAIMGQFGIYGHSKFIIFFASVLLVFYLFKNIFQGFATWMQVRFVMRNQIYYSNQLLRGYLSKPYLFHINHNSGVLLRNVNNGGTVVFGSIVLPLLYLVVECATAAAIFLMLLWVDSFMAIAMAGFFGGLVAIILKSFRKYINQQGEVQKDCQAQMFMWGNQSLSAIKETKVMRTEHFFIEKCGIAYRRLGEANGRYTFLNSVPRLLIEVVGVGGLLFLVILKLLIGERPMDIVPLLGLLALALFRLMPSANRIVSYYNAIKFQMPFFHEMYPEFMEIKQKSAIDGWDMMLEDSAKIPFEKEICIEHLAFSYDGKQEILRDVSMRIAKGDFVGIVGPSGVGKTTFVDILLGLLAPTCGQIRVDGQDISADIRGWQANLGYVPQTIYLVDASIKENIAIGQNDVDIDEVWMEQVLRMAELYDFVQSLPDGVNTSVGERGVRLSGGQRQRIGIARAIYQQPKVLVLDEATSALDGETEKSIVETILKLKGKMTIISIAHRISTLEDCDYKVHFHDGVCEVV